MRVASEPAGEGRLEHDLRLLRATLGSGCDAVVDAARRRPGRRDAQGVSDFLELFHDELRVSGCHAAAADQAATARRVLCRVEGLVRDVAPRAAVPPGLRL